MTPDDSTPEAGRRRADELLRLLPDDAEGAQRLLGRVDDVRELVFVGAALTATARAEARQLPPAQRAQASTRQARLGQLRDAQRAEAQRGAPAGLRTWLLRSAEEVLLIRSLQATADRVLG